MMPFRLTALIALASMLAAIIAFQVDAPAQEETADAFFQRLQEGMDSDQVGRDQESTFSFWNPEAAQREAEMDDEIDDIQQIRVRLGIDLYRGTSLENAEDQDAETEFLEVYRRIANRPRHRATVPWRAKRAATLGLPASRDLFPLFDALSEAARQLDLAGARRESSPQPDEAAGVSQTETDPLREAKQQPAERK